MTHPSAIEQLVSKRVLTPAQAEALEVFRDFGAERWSVPELRSVPEHTRFYVERVLEPSCTDRKPKQAESQGRDADGLEIVQFDENAWSLWRDDILRIDRGVFEGARRESEEFLAAIPRLPRSVCLVAVVQDHAVAFSLSGPLEGFPNSRGVLEDREFGEYTTLYSSDFAIERRWQRKGLGKRLKLRQMMLARAAGYDFIAGQIRLPDSAAMWRLNTALGAHAIKTFRNSFGDRPPSDDVDCVYYRVNLTTTSVNSIDP
jgi:GNAT superfamily N-acetyltransferase